ncbi:TPA: hypothetical protein EYP38_00790 [Candidatus Micrarchaeota archaeon]|nr:hypothetical protein [Candidatus Micrarchaeota archaeon]
MVAIPVPKLGFRERREMPKDPLQRLGDRRHAGNVRSIIASRRALIGEKAAPLHDEPPEAVLMRHPDAQRLGKGDRDELIRRLGPDVHDFDRVSAEAGMMIAVRGFMDSLEARGAKETH